MSPVSPSNRLDTHQSLELELEMRMLQKLTIEDDAALTVVQRIELCVNRHAKSLLDAIQTPHAVYARQPDNIETTERHLVHCMIDRCWEKLREVSESNSSDRSKGERSQEYLFGELDKVLEEFACGKITFSRQEEGQLVAHDLFERFRPSTVDAESEERRLLQAPLQEFTTEHLDAFEDLYNRSLIKKRDVLLLNAGAVDEVNKWAKFGMHIQPPNYERQTMEKLLAQTEKAKNAPPHKRHQFRTMYGTVLMDPLTKKMDSIAVSIVSSQKGSKDPQTKKLTENFFANGISGKQPHFPKPNEKEALREAMNLGKDVFLFYMASRRKGQISRVLAANLSRCLAERSDLTTLRTYALRGVDLYRNGQRVTDWRVPKMDNYSSDKTLKAGGCQIIGTETDVPSSGRRRFSFHKERLEVSPDWNIYWGELAEIINNYKIRAAEQEQFLLQSIGKK